LTRPLLPLIAVLLGTLSSPGRAASPVVDVFRPTVADLERSPSIDFPGTWLYRDGDDPSYARPGVDTSSWSPLTTALRAGETRRFHGIGWFRTRIDLPAGLAGRPLALRAASSGAGELFVDGRKAFSWGSIGADGTAVLENPLVGHVLLLDEGVHDVAVRFSNPRADSFRSAGYYAGFQLSLGLAERALPADVDRAIRGAAGTWLFTGVFLSFGVLHLLLFFFLSDLRENLHFALLCFANAFLAYALFSKDVMRDPQFALRVEPWMGVAGVLLSVSSVLFTGTAFGATRPRAVTGAILAAAAGLSAWSLVAAAAAVPFVFLAMLAGSLEAVRTVAVAALRRKPGALLIGTGMAALGAGFGVGLLRNLGVDMSFLGPRRIVSVVVPFSSVVVLLLLSSIHLARRVATTWRELARRVEEVTRLSAEKLEQERRAREEEVARTRLEAEYARKARELEEARELQVSMLPKEPPRLPGLEIAARMTTATEVGGDYYDFEVGDDGALTIAIGDATGHGMKAGTLVAATKGLFGVLSGEPELTRSVARAAASLRRMNLRSLTMALTLVRISGETVRIVAAGMPPVLVRRAATGVVESILVPGMPLGGRTRFPYAQAVTSLAPGDMLLLMSDGLPERLDPEDEMLDYERTAALFADGEAGTADEVVDRILGSADAFARGRPPEDDVTVVAVRSRLA
jgi:serine phosphatase RsbU (regulator of sigma subunit)